MFASALSAVPAGALQAGGLITDAGVPTGWGMFASEFFGTFTLVLLGCGVVAGQVLPRTKNHGGGWLMVAFGWGLAVYAGVYAAYLTGGHLNPAVTFALALKDGQLTDGVPATAANIFYYVAGQLLGAIIGAIVVFLTHKKHFDEEAPAADKLGVFATGPEIRSYGWNLFTEIVATFALVAFVVVSGKTPTEVGPLGVALVVVAIGVSLGGPTGYAINPARDLGPRIAHAILPIRGKGTSDWAYSWVPVLGPVLGGLLAAVLVPLFVSL